jgi:hypothetical protein
MSEREVLRFFRRPEAQKRDFGVARALHWPSFRTPKTERKPVMANGEVWIEITAQDGGYLYKETGNTTEGSVAFETEGEGFTLTADQGIYAFTFIAVNFQFSVAAVVWAQPGGNRNLTWASKDRTEFAMTNINFVKGAQQAVSFTINPANDDPMAVVLKPIDPTVLNNPLPGGSEIVTTADALFVQEAVMAG